MRCIPTIRSNNIIVHILNIQKYATDFINKILEAKVVLSLHCTYKRRIYEENGKLWCMRLGECDKFVYNYLCLLAFHASEPDFGAHNGLLVIFFGCWPSIFLGRVIISNPKD